RIISSCFPGAALHTGYACLSPSFFKRGVRGDLSIGCSEDISIEQPIDKSPLTPLLKKEGDKQA
ncbi:MAG: hypothetical protein AAGG80_02460, partial [Pseudomonadota bacterium]